MAWGKKDGKIEIIFKIKMIMNTTVLPEMCFTKGKKGEGTTEGEKEEVKSQLEQQQS